MCEYMCDICVNTCVIYVCIYEYVCNICVNTCEYMCNRWEFACGECVRGDGYQLRMRPREDALMHADVWVAVSSGGRGAQVCFVNESK
jgi:hypothetical protein